MDVLTEFLNNAKTGERLEFTKTEDGFITVERIAARSIVMNSPELRLISELSLLERTQIQERQQQRLIALSQKDELHTQK